ncbi:MAG: PIN domain nuclease [Bacteroidetes bacterium]|nr:PIN domain nuclease [Bacteroidota bacterium]
MVDTSVWIDAINGVKNKQSKLLHELIEDDAGVVLCPVIIQEILQGIKSDQEYKLVKENIFGFEIISLDPVEVAVGAAELFREMRKKGITIRKSNDCTIAYYAIKSNSTLLHKDNDFLRIARHTNLKIFG